MVDITLVYWRDIPAQVIAGKGRRAAKVVLPEVFEQVIDRCAMKEGLSESDDYLAQWRKAAPYSYDANGLSDAQIAQEIADAITLEYTHERFKNLIESAGWEPTY